MGASRRQGEPLSALALLSGAEETSLRQVDQHHHKEDDFKSLAVLAALMTMSLFGLTLILFVKALIQSWEAGAMAPTSITISVGDIAMRDKGDFVLGLLLTASIALMIGSIVRLVDLMLYWRLRGAAICAARFLCSTVWKMCINRTTVLRRDINRNEIASQAGDTNHQKSNSYTQAAA
jgi:hypothetical protein